MVKFWPFSRKKRSAVTDPTPAFVMQLLHRLDDQDKQMCHMEALLDQQARRIDQLIKRVDRATGRGAA